MTDPTDLREYADRLRERADEIAEDNPTASEYQRLKADWCERLARERDEGSPDE